MGICAALVASCGPTDGPLELVPTIEAIEPASGYAQADTPVVLRGTFPVRVEASYSGEGSDVIDARYRAWVGTVELRDVARVDATTATAVVPAGLPPGAHALAVESPFGTRATLAAAFTVRQAVLFGTASVLPRISVGQRATLTLTVANSGAADVRGVAPSLDVFAGAARVRDVSADPPPQDVPAAGTASFTWTLTGAAAGPVELALDASGIDAAGGGAQQMPRVTAGSTVQTPPALVLATASVAPATATVGQEIAVTAVVRNDGEATAAGVVGEVSSPSFGGLGAPTTSPGAQDLASGASATFTWTYQPTAATAGGVTLSISAEGTDANSGEPVAATPAPTNVLLVNPPALVSANLEAPAQVTSGQEITATLTVTNTGAAPADVTPTLDDPAETGTATVTPGTGSTLPTVRIPGGERRTFTWTFASGGSGEVAFAAHAAWDDVNSKARGTANTAPVTVQVLAPGDLAIRSAAARPLLVAAGGTVTVEVVVENLGGSTVAEVTATITAAPPGFTLTSEPLPRVVPGGTVADPFTWTYAVEPGATGGSFTVQVTGIEQNTQQPRDAGPATTNDVAVGYPVGGTVTGLAGAGLVLRNGAELLPVAAGSPTFTFQTPIATGDAYDVTVEAQPASPSQQCVVDPGTATGTVGPEPVTTVAVSCTTSLFTLGGNITGLEGTGLVLRNGVETITLGPGDTTFTFPSPLASGSTYDVVVDVQPTTPTQSCEVTFGRGTVTDADVTSVRVACATLTFTIGGTITGLEGRNLELRNGDDVLEFRTAINGPFTFETRVPSSATYAVIVQSQPTKPTQTCSVANGTGTVGSANVTDVVVSCSTETFSVGGIVDGLLGTGLTLTDGAESVGISGDGPFIFPTALADLTPYAVAVVSHPSDPTQECTVANGVGAIDGADVTNVTVDCTIRSFLVGGTVNGLVDPGLVLHNGGEFLPILSGATIFAFPTPVDSGAMYEVTIAAQPLRQTCEVLSGVGVIGGADVTSVLVSCSPPSE